MVQWLEERDEFERLARERMAEIAAVEAEEPLLQQLTFVETGPAIRDTVQAIRTQYRTLALNMCRTVPRSANRTVALRTLIAAKDDMIRALIFAPAAQ